MKGKRKKYECVFKEKLVITSYQRNCITQLENEFGLFSGALTRWRQHFEKSGSKNYSSDFYLNLRATDLRIRRLRQKINKTDLKFEILKKAGPYLNKGRESLFQFIYSNEKNFSVKLMCSVLQAGTVTYSRWKNHILTETQKRQILLEQEITSIFFASKQRYGSKRIAAEMQNLGYQITGSGVRKYMEKLGLSAKVKK